MLSNEIQVVCFAFEELIRNLLLKESVSMKQCVELSISVEQLVSIELPRAIRALLSFFI